MLTAVHRDLLRGELAAGRLGSVPRFSGEAYHPHVTAIWGASKKPAAAIPERLLVTGVAVSLYSYDRDPHEDPVRRRVLVDRAASACSPRASR